METQLKPSDTFLPFEVVFNPRWWHHAAGISFERPFYLDPAARTRNDIIMRRVLHERFGALDLGKADPRPRPVAGPLYVAGGFVIPALLGAEIRFEPDAAPQPLPARLPAEQLEHLEAPDWRVTWPMSELIAGWDAQEAQDGYLIGDLNTDGVLNAAYHFYGQELFADFYDAPDRVRRVLEVIADLIVDVASYVRARTGSCSIAVNRMAERVDPRLFIHANCSVQMISPRSYRTLHLPIEQRMASRIQPFGIHHCGDNMHQVAAAYAELGLAFADVGWGSDVAACRRAVPDVFLIEVLTTTDAASDPLAHHRALAESGWDGRVVPTFRPDAVVHLLTPGWSDHLMALGRANGSDITSYPAFVRALEDRRAFFKSMGATATDHAAETAFTGRLDAAEAEAIFGRALRGEITAEDARRFTGHMLMEMARMSVEDGLVMQLHIGAIRGHNALVRTRFGNDKGADIPTTDEFTHNLRPLLDAHGNDPRLTLILFTLDETTYARELAPLAGHYPALRLGPPWGFHDSPNGMRRYFDQVIEPAGLYDTAGFNDDTRAFCSIPARHDVWRRVSCDWLAGLVVRGQVDDTDAADMAHELAYDLAKRAYRL